jgi:hypothetical protein
MARADKLILGMPRKRFFLISGVSLSVVAAIGVAGIIAGGALASHGEDQGKPTSVNSPTTTVLECKPVFKQNEQWLTLSSPRQKKAPATEIYDPAPASPDEPAKMASPSKGNEEKPESRIQLAKTPKAGKAPEPIIPNGSPVLVFPPSPNSGSSLGTLPVKGPEERQEAAPPAGPVVPLLHASSTSKSEEDVPDEATPTMEAMVPSIPRPNDGCASDPRPALSTNNPDNHGGASSLIEDNNAQSTLPPVPPPLPVPAPRIAPMASLRRDVRAETTVTANSVIEALQMPAMSEHEPLPETVRDLLLNRDFRTNNKHTHNRLKLPDECDLFRDALLPFRERPELTGHVGVRQLLLIAEPILLMCAVMRDPAMAIPAGLTTKETDPEKIAKLNAAQTRAVQELKRSNNIDPKCLEHFLLNKRLMEGVQAPAPDWGNVLNIRIQQLCQLTNASDADVNGTAEDDEWE